MAKYSSFKPGHLKIENKLAVFRYIYEKECISKVDISKDLGMSKPTASSIVEELLNEGYIAEAGYGTSSVLGGKRPQLYRLQSLSLVVMSVYIGVGIIQAALMDVRANVLARKQQIVNWRDVNVALKSLEHLIQELLLYSKQQNMQVYGIGISAPGVIESRTGILVNATHLEGWEHIPLGPRLKSKFQIPVWIDNESNNMALAEKWFGTGKGASTFITIQTEGGLGTGIIINGEIFNGANNSGGEFGHTTININGPVCRCGNTGCWELYAAEFSFLKDCEEMLHDLPDHPLSEVLSQGDVLNFDFIAKCYQQNDPHFTPKVNEYALYLACGIINLVNGFNPELIIISGNLEKLGSPFLELVDSIVTMKAIPSASQRVKICFSSLEDTRLIGAATLVITDILDGNIFYAGQNHSFPHKKAEV